MTKSSSIVMELKDVTKHYGRARGIESINLSITEGEVFGFLGPNGAGKSTTINAILDLLHIDEGSISLFGLDHHRDGVAARRQIGYLSGDMATDPNLTGSQYLALAAHLHGGVSKERIDRLVRMLRCETNKKIKSLSRGNRQKIGLIAALMHDPDLLILDEPTSGLDPLVQNEFNQLIRERREQQKTTFMSSHVLSEVQSICDRVGFIREGKLIRVSSLNDLVVHAPRRVNVIYSAAAPDTQLHALTGVTDMKIQGQQRSFRFTGNYNELIRVISMKPIKDLQILEPQLEKLFMGYYQSEENQDV